MLLELLESGTAHWTFRGWLRKKKQIEQGHGPVIGPSIRGRPGSPNRRAIVLALRGPHRRTHRSCGLSVFITAIGVEHFCLTKPTHGNM
jgi:hypothetical protein